MIGGVPAEQRIAIVGAGIIGLATAFELSRRGALVTVFDQRQIAGGATQASAGILAPYTEAHGRQSLFELTVRGLAVYEDFVGRVRAISPLAFEYQRAGTLEVADSPQRAAELADRLTAPWASAAGLEWLTAGELRARVPGIASGALGGLRCAVHGHVAVESLVRAVADAGERHGVVFQVGSAVECVSLDRPGVRLSVGREALDFDRVVLCGGAWGPLLDPLGALAGRIRPVRGQLVRLHAGERSFREVLWSSSCYVVPWEDGTVLVGATSEEVGFDERATAEGVRQMLDAAERLVPPLARATFVNVRVGLRPGTADGLPILGPSPDPRVIYAAGHFRNGILLAPLTADLVAHYISDGALDPAFSAT